MSAYEKLSLALLQHIADGLAIQTNALLALAASFPNAPDSLRDTAKNHVEWQKTLLEVTKVMSVVVAEKGEPQS